MKVDFLTETQYNVVSPYTGVDAVESQLLTEAFLVVKDGSNYIGILTPADLVASAHHLVADCLSPKPVVDSEDTLQNVLPLMDSPSTRILPVFAHGQFLGVIRQQRISEYLASYYQDLEKDIAQKTIELQQKNEQLVQQEKMAVLGQLAGGIAHDFNNLLVPIIGYAELGQMSIPPNHELFAYFAEIQKAAERAADLTQQILAFSRKQILRTRPIDLNELILDHKKMLHRLLRENIQLQILLSPSLKSTRVDKSQIERVLLNLVLNAQDAMPTGGNLTIATANVLLDDPAAAQRPDAQPGPYVVLTVSDTGHGMDAATRARIFEPFFTTKKLGHGTGLGLSSVFGIVSQHNGHIVVRSEPGQGASFEIYLPQKNGESSSVETTNGTNGTSLTGSETILVVEDEEMVRQVVCTVLAAHGYTILEADTPHRALHWAEKHKEPIHLLLTDVIMPDMNGFELHQKIVALQPNIKVLYTSGYADDIVARQKIGSAGTNFLQKPYNSRDLIQMVRQALDLA